MITHLKESLRKQFGASIDMLRNAIDHCPEELWIRKKRFLFVSYHTLIFLEYYLTFPPVNFSPALSYTVNDDWEKIEGALDDLIPSKDYTKADVLDYLAHCRLKCYTLISSLDEARLNDRWIDDSGTKNYSVVEILLYNMRHVQHHAAQLNMMLRQEINDAPRWVSRAKD
jgi:hypothetical protein